MTTRPARTHPLFRPLLAAALVLACLQGAVAQEAATATEAPQLTSDPRLPRPRPDAAAGAPTAGMPANAEAAGSAEPPATTEAAADTGAAPKTEAAKDAAKPEAADPAAATAAAEPFMPRPRPPISEAEATRMLAVQFHGFRPDFRLRAALDAVRDKRYGDARGLAEKHGNPDVPALVEWLIARQPDSGLSAARVIALIQSHRGWPEPEVLQLRAEQAFHALGEAGAPVLTFYGQVEPMTVGGRLALADALRDAGRAAEADAIVRDLWHVWTLAPAQAATILTRFGAALTREDHLVRFRRLVLRTRSEDAAAQAELLGAGYADLAKAVIAVLDRRSDAAKLMRAQSERFADEPLYAFGSAWLLRRSDKPVEAARLLTDIKAGPALLGDNDVWWEERRDLSRVLLDRGDADLAYRLVAAAAPDGDGDRVEAAFHAGWIALRFLDDPKRAELHFRTLHSLATLPRTQARAAYWLGRVHEAEGSADAARLDYEEAARFGGAFYGQLAREKLGIVTTGMERMPRPSAMDRVRFADRDLVRITRLLASAGYAELAAPFITQLGMTVDTPGEVTLASTLARRIGRPLAGTRAAALAEARGLAVAGLPALFLGVPPGLEPPASVDRALVYAIVRQESAFDHTAVSHAGARGLMQLMPATARATARAVRIPFSEQRLVTDPLYNATLGAHHLGELLGGLRRSYILTFAGYNAGPGRALEWVQDYGDPRNGGTDPIDWIERIPFDETRDYVQKVMENLQLYRSRTGHPLSLSQDLVRGGPQG